jgi:hypothetical protein
VVQYRCYNDSREQREDVRRKTLFRVVSDYVLNVILNVGGRGKNIYVYIYIYIYKELARDHWLKRCICIVYIVHVHTHTHTFYVFEPYNTALTVMVITLSAVTTALAKRFVK